MTILIVALVFNLQRTVLLCLVWSSLTVNLLGIVGWGMKLKAAVEMDCTVEKIRNTL